MSIAGHIYGVVLNDRREREQFGELLREPPYLSEPQAPVVYMLPSSSLAHGPVVQSDQTELLVSTTLALLFSRDACRIGADDVWRHVGASALAIELARIEANYYRPAIVQRNADGFLSLAPWGDPKMADEITLAVNGVPVHRWALSRLVRSVGTLVSDLSAFMTIRAGDVLLVGLPGDAPRAKANCCLRASSPGFTPAVLKLEAAA